MFEIGSAQRADTNRKGNADSHRPQTTHSRGIAMPGYTLIEMAAREGAAEFIEAVSKIELTSDERVAFSRSPRAYLVERNVPNLTIQVGDAELGVYDLLE